VSTWFLILKEIAITLLSGLEYYGQPLPSNQEEGENN
jgi:hypothetical protein